MNSEHPLFVNLPRLLEAISDYPGNSTVRKVVCDVAQFANRYGTAFTTMRSVAARTGLSPMTVCRAYHIAEDTGLWDLTKEKKGLDRHPRDVAHFKRWFLRRHPDKQSSHYNASKWRRWCEIGRKRAITIKLKQKKTGTIRDTAAEMATRPIAASASPTPSQAREARQQRGGGCDSFGGVLAGLFPTASSAATQPVQVTDPYKSDLKQRGELLQQLREHEAQPVPAPAPQAPADGTAGAWQEVARGYSRASRPTAASAYPADSSSPWPSSTVPVQPIRQPATPPVVEQTADSADAYRETAKDKSYWLQRLRELKAQYAAESAAVTCETR